MYVEGCVGAVRGPRLPGCSDQQTQRDQPEQTDVSDQITECNNDEGLDGTAAAAWPGRAGLPLQLPAAVAAGKYKSQAGKYT